ncbi:MAG: hypothetical protein WBM17_17375 [Anaerolineales bacterium]
MKPASVSFKRISQSHKNRILFPGLILSLLMAACAPTPGGTPTPGSTPSPSGDARAAVLQAIQAHLAAGPYRVVAATTAGENTVAMHGEVILPDKFHLFSSVSGGPEREYIIIGSATYAHVNGQWTPVQIDLSGLIANFIDRLDPTAISDVLLAGPDAVNGTPALAYTYTYTNTVEGALITNHEKIWVGTSSGLPIKQVVDGEVSGTAYHSEQTIEYDSSITIAAPVTP